MVFFEKSHPILGESVSTQDFTPIDLGPQSPISIAGSTPSYEELASFVNLQIEEAGAKYGYGGYLEERSIYKKSPLFGTGKEARIMHLGIDIWAPAHTPIYLPIRGLIHSFKYNDGMLDYGGTIILSCSLPSGPLFLLFGHLSKASLAEKKIGQMLEAGTLLADLGDRSENGGWPPHLHFQVIKDLQGMVGDYPGVVAKKELPFYQDNCPDPMPLIRNAWSG